MAMKLPVAHCLYPPPLPPHCFAGVRRSLHPSPPSLTFLYRGSCLGIHFVPLLAAHHLKSAKAVRFDGPFLEVREIEGEDCELVVETCITRTLQPAVTLEAGLQSIEEALRELKQNPPGSTGGVLRFQVAVPPSPKALNWFCALPPSSAVFPRFFFSKETDDDPSCKSLYLNRTRGVFGIGAAIYFTNSSPSASGDQSLIRRYISSDSVGMTTYGFVDVGFQSSFKLESGSLYFCIPEVELDELVDISILSATLAWNDSTSNVIRQAIQSLELSLHEASSHFCTATERCDHISLASALGKSNVVEDRTFKVFPAQVELLEGSNYQVYPSELSGTLYYRQFCFRLSPTIGISNNMLDLAIGTSYPLQHQANINAVWASLIVEECARLGLTFFCIAPGSRSSPLAIAASSHGKITCIACFDERSLAFHAVGYSKGSQKPAVVITSSGTAVSNLLPAVVEASQDFVPLLLLTADRPPELQDTGANQTINQVNHFGSFVRFFFNLPVPSDTIPARMVLTVLDSAVNWATSPPYGPVHLNCPFREPLDGSPEIWMLTCLSGLDNWMCKGEPFTKYIKVQHSCNTTNHAALTEVIDIIQGAKRGLLLICALDTEDEIWSALLFAKHLNWPVVADILSGLRLRNVLTSCPEIQENVVFLDHLDHVLLSDSVKRWIHFDVIVQIGKRITSKRISQMLEERYPYSYILVDNHPCRHDPSHLVSHRIQCSVLQFVDTLMKVQFPLTTRNFCSYLQAMDKTVAWDILFQISAEPSLTEPYVAYAVSEILGAEFALFVGNSMAIRDADMYGHSWKDQTHMTTDMLSCSELPCLGIRVSGNRGASGIDGLLSTASGFAAGCNRRVVCVIGDVSFLHDTNGLVMLNRRMFRKPMTVLVINNHGGAIFGLLPIADRTNPTVLSQYFYTSHDISIEKLCLAHSVRHFQAKTKVELRDALLSSQLDQLDCVIEAESGIDANTAFHSTLRKSARQAADDAFSCLSRLSTPSSDGFLFCKIHKMEYSLYRIELCAPTSASFMHGRNDFHKDGYVLALSLEDGTVGYGEVAPIEIHNESLADAEEQLRFLCHIIEGAKIAYPLPLLKGTFTSWFWNNLGIPDCSIFPSVRCGLEMAILNAMAASTGSNFLDILQPQKVTEEMHGMSKHVNFCALIDSNGTPHEVANIAASLVAEGFTAIKLKVARRENPHKDAAVLQEVRKAVGMPIQLRVDANRKWTFEEAILFGSLVKDCDLQYIEEPVQDEEEIIKYCDESGLPVALDETIDNLTGNPLHMLAKYAHPKVVAVVIKPSFVGGFEKAAQIARWAHQEGKMAVVSAAFESGLALSTYVLFSYYVDLQRVGPSPSIAHGLGTYRWLKQDTTTQHFRVSPDPCSRSMGASTIDAIQHLEQFQLDDSIISRTFSGEQVRRYTMTVKTNEFSYVIRAHEVGQKHDGNVVVFLHGFLGTGEDWIPIMKAISGSARCISIDLPGHGETKGQMLGSMEVNHDCSLSVERVSELLCKLIQDLTPGKVTLVGYSMGARIALHMALRFGDKVNGAVILSGSPGLQDEMARKIRRAKDNSRARNLITYGLQTFLTSWYAGKLWKSLRCHPHFKEVVASRLLHGDAQSLANALSDLSIGRQEPLWDDLEHCKLPLLFVVGSQDYKFKAIAQQMVEEVEKGKNEGDGTVDNICEILEVQESGHAVHLENPLPLVRALRRFMTRARNS